MKRLLAVSTLATVFGVCSMFGSMISFSSTVPTSSVPFSDSFTLSGFNTALGTLTGITVTLAYTDSASVQVVNITNTPYAFTNGSALSNILVTGPIGLLETVAANVTGISGIANPGVSIFPGAPSGGSQSSNPTDFADYETGPVAVNFSVSDSGATYTGQTSAPGGALYFGGSESAGGSVTLTYTYTAATSTPEPATITLLGSALLGIGFIARKRLKNS